MRKLMNVLVLSLLLISLPYKIKAQEFMFGLYAGPSLSKIVYEKVGDQITRGYHLNGVFTGELPYFFCSEIGLMHTPTVSINGDIKETYWQIGGGQYLFNTKLYAEGLFGAHRTMIDNALENEELLDYFTDLGLNL